MKTNSMFFALIIYTMPLFAFGQTDQDSIEGAKLALIEKLREAGGDTFHKALAEKGLSEDQIQTSLFRAFDEYATCIVDAAQAQAREQGLPEDIVLKGIGGGTRGKEESAILLQLDTDALKQKNAPCNERFNEALGLKGG